MNTDASIFAVKLIYLSSKQYPSATADGLFVAEAAKAMGRLLGSRFLFVVARNAESERFTGMQIHELGLARRTLRTAWYFLTFPKLRRHLNDDTVIYSNEQPLVLVALLWRPLFHYRVVYEAHGFFNWRRDRAFLHLWRWAIDGITATSDALRNLMVGLEPKLAGRISVVRGGADAAMFAATGESEKTRAEIGIGPDDVVVAYAGHFKTRGEKGLSTLMDAVCGSDDYVRLLLIGGKPAELEEYRARCHCGRCVLLGWADQRAAVRYLRAADILVIPTSRDTLYTRYSFPMKVYDSLALGKPTVVSDVPIIREVMTDDVAIACDPGDADGLAQAIAQLADDPALRERLGRAARERASRYTWDERARQIARRSNAHE